MSEPGNVIPGPWAAPSAATNAIDRDRAERAKQRQQLAEAVRARAIDPKAKFERREDRVRPAQAIDEIMKQQKITPGRLQSELNRNGGPKLHAERLKLDHRLPFHEASRQARKGLYLTLQPYVRAADTLVGLIGASGDDLLAKMFHETSFSRHGPIVVDDRADRLAKLMQLMASAVVKAERLDDYFARLRITPGFYDDVIEDFVPGRGILLSDSGLEGDVSIAWWPVPLPSLAAPLLRVPQLRFSGKLFVESSVIAPAKASPANVAKQMSPLITELRGKPAPLGAGHYCQAELTIFADVRLVIGPRSQSNDIGPMFEVRTFVELKTDGKVRPLSFPYSIIPLTEPAGDSSENDSSELEDYVGSVAARFDDGWHRVSGFGPKLWKGLDEDFGDLFGLRLDTSLAYWAPVSPDNGDFEFTLHWYPVNAATVAQLMQHLASSHKTPALKPGTIGTAPSEFLFPESPAIETALSTGSIEEALRDSCKQLKAKLSERIEKFHRVRDLEWEPVIKRWTDMDSGSSGD